MLSARAIDWLRNAGYESAPYDVRVELIKIAKIVFPSDEEECESDDN